MGALTYVLTAGVFFWSGSIHEAARQPIQPAQIVPVYKTPLMWLACDPQMEVERKRACYHRSKSL